MTTSWCFSPAIHRQLGGYDYQLVELSPDQVGPFLQEGNFRGLNVTIPYKKTVMAYCRELSPAAERIGSVNTIVRRPTTPTTTDSAICSSRRELRSGGRRCWCWAPAEPP